MQITSGASCVSKFWSRERRIFAWQVKPQNVFLGSVKDFPTIYQSMCENNVLEQHVEVSEYPGCPNIRSQNIGVSEYL